MNLKNTQKFGVKATALIIAGLFIWETLVCAAPASLPEVLSGQSSMISDEVRSESLVEKIQIPSSLGSIQEVFVSSVARGAWSVELMHIEDAHGEPDAQKNTQAILEHLKKEYGIQTFFLEGAWSKLDPALLSFSNDAEENQKILSELTEKGIVGGPENFLYENFQNNTGGQTAATSSLSFPRRRESSWKRLDPRLRGDGKQNTQQSSEQSNRSVAGYGIEDLELYKKNLDQFRAVIGAKAESDTFLNSMKAGLLTKASQVLNPELAGHFRQWSFHEEVETDYSAHLRVLAEQAQKHLSLDLGDAREQYDWAQLVRFQKLKSYERATNHEPRATNEEEGRLFDWLNKNGFEKEKKALKDLSVARGAWPPPRRAGVERGDARAFFESFYERVSPKGFKFKDYPALSKEWGKQILSQELDAPTLIKEIETLENKLIEKLAVTPDEKRLVAKYREYLLLKKLLNLELSRDEWKQIEPRATGHEPRRDLRTGSVPSEARDVSDEEQKDKAWSVVRGSWPASVKVVYQKAVEFYRTAEERDERMFNKTLDWIKKEKIERAAIITGGFHSQGMGELLKQKNISYMRVQPRISQIYGRENYLKLMIADNHHTPGVWAGSNLRFPSPAEPNPFEPFRSDHLPSRSQAKSRSEVPPYLKEMLDELAIPESKQVEWLNQRAFMELGGGMSPVANQVRAMSDRDPLKSVYHMDVLAQGEGALQQLFQNPWPSELDGEAEVIFSANALDANIVIFYRRQWPVSKEGPMRHHEIIAQNMAKALAPHGIIMILTNNNQGAQIYKDLQKAGLHVWWGKGLKNKVFAAKIPREEWVAANRSESRVSFDLAHLAQAAQSNQHEITFDTETIPAGMLSDFVERLNQKELDEVAVLGGAVRDTLTGKMPKDIDFVVKVSLPDNLLREFENDVSLLSPIELDEKYQLSFRAEKVFSKVIKKMGFSRAKLKNLKQQVNGYPVEHAFATFIVGDYLIDKGFWSGFTIDQIAIDRYGRVYQPYQALGLEDLQRGVIRASPQLGQRKAAPSLKTILKAIRYKHQFGFEIESETQKALANRVIVWKVNPIPLKIKIKMVRQSIVKVISGISAHRELAGAYLRYGFYDIKRVLAPNGFVLELPRKWLKNVIETVGSSQAVIDDLKDYKVFEVFEKSNIAYEDIISQRSEIREWISKTPRKDFVNQRRELGVKKELISEVAELQRDYGVGQTPLLESAELNAWLRKNFGLGARLLFKDETTNPTGSFKDRSPMAVYLAAKKDQPPHLVLAVSTGNQGRAVANAVKVIQKKYPAVQVEIYLPSNALPHKIQAIEDLGAKAITVRPDNGQLIQTYAEALQIVENLEKQNDALAIPHADPEVVAGYSVAGVEIFEQLTELEIDPTQEIVTLVGPLGSGGFFSGLLELKARQKNVRAIAAAAHETGKAYQALTENRPDEDSPTPKEIHTDGSAATAEPFAIDLISQSVDGIIRVTDEDALYATALLHLFEIAGHPVEATSGIALAAALLYPEAILGSQVLVMPLTSRNVSEATLARIKKIDLEQVEKYFSTQRALIKTRSEIRDYGNLEDFAGRHQVNVDLFNGSKLGKKSIAEIIAHELPSAVYAFQQIKNLRMELDKRNDRWQRTPLLLWQNMRLGEFYPLMTERVKEALEITLELSWSEADEFVQKSELERKAWIESKGKQRVVLVREKISSRLPHLRKENIIFLESIYLFSKHAFSSAFWIFVDHGQQILTVAQSYVKKWLKVQSMGMDLSYLASEEKGVIPSDHVMKFREWAVLLNARKSEDPSWFDDNSSFVDPGKKEEDVMDVFGGEHRDVAGGDEIIQIGSRKMKVRDAAKEYFGQTLDRTLEEKEMIPKARSEIRGGKDKEGDGSTPRHFTLIEKGDMAGLVEAARSDRIMIRLTDVGKRRLFDELKYRLLSPEEASRQMKPSGDSIERNTAYLESKDSFEIFPMPFESLEEGSWAYRIFSDRGDGNKPHRKTARSEARQTVFIPEKLLNSIFSLNPEEVVANIPILSKLQPRNGLLKPDRRTIKDLEAYDILRGSDWFYAAFYFLAQAYAAKDWDLAAEIGETIIESFRLRAEFLNGQRLVAAEAGSSQENVHNMMPEILLLEKMALIYLKYLPHKVHLAKAIYLRMQEALDFFEKHSEKLNDQQKALFIPLIEFMTEYDYVHRKEAGPTLDRFGLLSDEPVQENAILFEQKFIMLLEKWRKTKDKKAWDAVQAWKAAGIKDPRIKEEDQSLFRIYEEMIENIYAEKWDVAHEKANILMSSVSQGFKSSAEKALLLTNEKLGKSEEALAGLVGILKAVSTGIRKDDIGANPENLRDAEQKQRNNIVNFLGEDSRSVVVRLAGKLLDEAHIVQQDAEVLRQAALLIFDYEAMGYDAQKDIAGERIPERLSQYLDESPGSEGPVLTEEQLSALFQAWVQSDFKPAAVWLFQRKVENKQSPKSFQSLLTEAAKEKTSDLARARLYKIEELRFAEEDDKDLFKRFTDFNTAAWVLQDWDFLEWIKSSVGEFSAGRLKITGRRKYPPLAHYFTIVRIVRKYLLENLDSVLQREDILENIKGFVQYFIDQILKGAFVSTGDRFVFETTRLLGLIASSIERHDLSMTLYYIYDKLLRANLDNNESDLHDISPSLRTSFAEEDYLYVFLNAAISISRPDHALHVFSRLIENILWRKSRAEDLDETEGQWVNVIARIHSFVLHHLHLQRPDDAEKFRTLLREQLSDAKVTDRETISRSALMLQFLEDETFFSDPKTAMAKLKTSVATFDYSPHIYISTLRNLRFVTTPNQTKLIQELDDLALSALATLQPSSGSVRVDLMQALYLVASDPNAAIDASKPKEWAQRNDRDERYAHLIRLHAFVQLKQYDQALQEVKEMFHGYRDVWKNETNPTHRLNQVYLANEIISFLSYLPRDQRPGFFNVFAEFAFSDLRSSLFPASLRAHLKILYLIDPQKTLILTHEWVQGWFDQVNRTSYSDEKVASGARMIMEAIDWMMTDTHQKVEGIVYAERMVALSEDVGAAKVLTEAREGLTSDEKWALVIRLMQSAHFNRAREVLNLLKEKDKNYSKSQPDFQSVSTALQQIVGFEKQLLKSIEAGNDTKIEEQLNKIKRLMGPESGVTWFRELHPWVKAIESQKEKIEEAAKEVRGDRFEVALKKLESIPEEVRLKSVRAKIEWLQTGFSKALEPIQTDLAGHLIDAAEKKLNRLIDGARKLWPEVDWKSIGDVNELRKEITASRDRADGLESLIRTNGNYEKVLGYAQELSEYPERKQTAFELVLRNGFAAFEDAAKKDSPDSKKVLYRKAYSWVRIFYELDEKDEAEASLKEKASALASQAAAGYWIASGIEDDLWLVHAMALYEQVRDKKLGSDKPFLFLSQEVSAKKIVLRGVKSAEGVGTDFFKKGDIIRFEGLDDFTFEVIKAEADVLELDIPKTADEGIDMASVIKKHLKTLPPERKKIYRLNNLAWKNQMEAFYPVVKDIRNGFKQDFTFNHPPASFHVSINNQRIHEVLGLKIYKRPADFEPHAEDLKDEMNARRDRGEFVLDEVQEKTAHTVLDAEHPRYGFIQGPPGTGKTTVIAWLADLFAKRKKQVLILSHAHKAVNNIALRILRHQGIDPEKLEGLKPEEMPLARGGNNSDSVHPLLLSAWKLREALYRLIEDGKRYIPILGVLHGLTGDKYLRDSRAREGDFLVIEEGGTLTVPESLLAIHAFGQSSEQFLFVGDPKQLPAFGVSDEDARGAFKELSPPTTHGVNQEQTTLALNGFGSRSLGDIFQKNKLVSFRVSLFEKAQNLMQGDGPLEERKIFKRTLSPFHLFVFQRRSKYGIVALNNNITYGGQLIAARSDDPGFVVEDNYAQGHEQDRDYFEAEAKWEDSSFNPMEVARVMHWVNHLINQKQFTPKDIAVITPYRGQVAAIQASLLRLAKIHAALRNVKSKDELVEILEWLKNVQPRDPFFLYLKNQGITPESFKGQWASLLEKPIEQAAIALRKQIGLGEYFIPVSMLVDEEFNVLTIDSSQGNEYKAVILSMVKSNVMGKVGFLGRPEDGPKRLNVADSRAEDALIKIWNRNTFLNAEGPGKNYVRTYAAHNVKVFGAIERKDWPLLKKMGGVRSEARKQQLDGGQRVVNGGEAKDLPLVSRSEARQKLATNGLVESPGGYFISEMVRDHSNKTPQLVNKIRSQLEEQGINYQSVRRIIYPAALTDGQTIAAFLEVFPSITEVILIDLYITERVEEIERMIRDQLKKYSGLKIEVVKADYLKLSAIAPMPDQGRTLLIDKYPGRDSSLRANPEYRESLFRDSRPEDLVFSIIDRHTAPLSWESAPLIASTEIPFLYGGYKGSMTELVASDFEKAKAANELETRSETRAEVDARIEEIEENGASENGELEQLWKDRDELVLEYDMATRERIDEHEIIRVGTFNLLAPGGLKEQIKEDGSGGRAATVTRLKSIPEVIKSTFGEALPHFFTLQEATRILGTIDNAWELAHALNYEYESAFYKNHDGGSEGSFEEGLAILWHSSFKKITSFRKKLVSTEGQPKIVFGVQLQSSITGEMFYVFTTHLDPFSPDMRKLQMIEVKKLIDETVFIDDAVPENTKVILTGDFNFENEEEANVGQKMLGENYQDAYVAANPQGRGITFSGKSNSLNPYPDAKKRLDLIYVRGMPIQDARVERKSPISDHFPVIADLKNNVAARSELRIPDNLQELLKGFLKAEIIRTLVKQADTVFSSQQIVEAIEIDVKKKGAFKNLVEFRKRFTALYHGDEFQMERISFDSLMAFIENALISSDGEPVVVAKEEKAASSIELEHRIDGYRRGEFYTLPGLKIVEEKNPGITAKIKKILATNFSDLTEGVDYDIHTGRLLILKLQQPVNGMEAIQVKGAAFEGLGRLDDFKISSLDPALSPAEVDRIHRGVVSPTYTAEGIFKLADKSHSPVGGMHRYYSEQEFKMAQLFSSKGIPAPVALAKATFSNVTNKKGELLGAVIEGLPSVGKETMGDMVDQSINIAFELSPEHVSRKRAIQNIQMLSQAQGKMLGDLNQKGVTHLQMHFGNTFLTRKKDQGLVVDSRKAAMDLYYSDLESALDQEEDKLTDAQFLGYVLISLHNAVSRIAPTSAVGRNASEPMALNAGENFLQGYFGRISSDPDLSPYLQNADNFLKELDKTIRISMTQPVQDIDHPILNAVKAVIKNRSEYRENEAAVSQVTGGIVSVEFVTSFKNRAEFRKWMSQHFPEIIERQDEKLREKGRKIAGLSKDLKEGVVLSPKMIGQEGIGKVLERLLSGERIAILSSDRLTIPDEIKSHARIFNNFADASAFLKKDKIMVWMTTDDDSDWTRLIQDVPLENKKVWDAKLLAALYSALGFKALADKLIALKSVLSAA